jgi:hypothetical protein
VFVELVEMVRLLRPDKSGRSNDKMGECLAMMEREGSSRWQRGTQNQAYFRRLKAFRIMPVKMLNIPTMMSRVVSTVVPRATWPVAAAI